MLLVIMIFTSFILVASTLQDEIVVDTYTKYSNQTFDSYQLVNVEVAFIYQGDCTPLNYDYVHSSYALISYELDYLGHELREITYYNQGLENVNISVINSLTNDGGANRIRAVIVLDETLYNNPYDDNDSIKELYEANPIRAVTVTNC